MTGFARRIGNTSNYMAELWALLDGLQLCLQMNAQSVIIELDAKVIMDALNSPPLLILLFPLSWKTADIWLTGFCKKDLGIYIGR